MNCYRRVRHRVSPSVEEVQMDLICRPENPRIAWVNRMVEEEMRKLSQERDWKELDTSSSVSSNLTSDSSYSSSSSSSEEEWESTSGDSDEEFP